MFFAGLYYFFFVYETVKFRLLTLYPSSLCFILSLRRPVCVICDARDKQRVKKATVFWKYVNISAGIGNNEITYNNVKKSIEDEFLDFLYA